MGEGQNSLANPRYRLQLALEARVEGAVQGFAEIGRQRAATVSLYARDHVFEAHADELPDDLVPRVGDAQFGQEVGIDLAGERL